MDFKRRPKALPQILKEIAETSAPIFCRATDYPAGWHVEPHSHSQHQLLYAERGVMVVQAEIGRWVVPPTRGIWMRGGMTHEIKCIEEVHMRSLLVAPDAASRLPSETHTVGISPLLRELIRAATEVRQPYAPNTRDGRVMRLILDELLVLPVLPLHLQMPSDPRLLRICERLQQVRLLRALELLATGEKIINVALALGYESPSAFTTMFRKQLGQTPSQYFRITS